MICDGCAVLAVRSAPEQGPLNLCAAYFEFEFVAKLMWPVIRLIQPSLWKKTSN